MKPMFSSRRRYLATCLDMNWTVLGALIDLQLRVQKADSVRWWNPFSWNSYRIRPNTRICTVLWDEYGIALYRTHRARVSVSQTGSVIFPVKGDPGVNETNNGFKELWDFDSEQGLNRRKLLADMITYYQGKFNSD